MDEILGILRLDLLIAVKAMVLLFLAMYIVFAFVVIKQTRLMRETIDMEFSDTMVKLSYLHFVLSIVLFVLSFVVL